MIRIDSREPLKIIKYAEQILGACSIELLPVGDIVDDIKGIVIERKEYSDFVASIKSGHLAKQLLDMKQFPHPYLLISGSGEGLHWQDIHWTVEQNAGALASLAVRCPWIKILMLPNDHQLILCAKAIIDKTDDGKEIDISKTELLKNTCTDKDVMVRMLCGQNRVGVVKATKLLLNEEIRKHLQQVLELSKSPKKNESSANASV